MKKFAALALLGFLFACSSNAGSNSQNGGANAAVLRPSTMTFKAADAACAGSLGSITFAMGHARAHATSGVDLNEQPESSSGVATMTFSDKMSGKAATVSVNGHNRSVSGKHVTAKMNQSVACVDAD